VPVGGTHDARTERRPERGGAPVQIGASAPVGQRVGGEQIYRSGAAGRPDLFPPIATFRHEFAASGQFFVKHQPGPHTDPARPDPTPDHSNRVAKWLHAENDERVPPKRHPF
jgi:hypothetical protein